MINADIITARINRVSGVINFRLDQKESRVLNQWTDSLHSLLNLTD